MEVKEEKILKNERVKDLTAEEMAAGFEEAVLSVRDLPGGIKSYIVLAMGRKTTEKGQPATICVNGKNSDLAFLYNSTPDDIKRVAAFQSLLKMGNAILNKEKKEEK